jgi:hypothetical protein
MGPNEQGWLFREGDLILGPVPGQQIIDKLYAGELLPQSEVQLMGSGRFQKVVDIPDFKLHVAKAEAKKRVDAQGAEHRSEQKKKTTRALAIGAGILVTLGIIVAVLGSYLAVHTPNGKTAEELAWGDITVDAPTISKAKRRVDDELVDYQGTGKKLAHRHHPEDQPARGHQASGGQLRPRRHVDGRGRRGGHQLRGRPEQGLADSLHQDRRQARRLPQDPHRVLDRRGRQGLEGVGRQQRSQGLGPRRVPAQGAPEVAVQGLALGQLGQPLVQRRQEGLRGLLREGRCAERSAPHGHR